MYQSNYKQTFNRDYFVGSGLVLADSTKTTADLVPLQLGLFNAKTYKALSSPVNAAQVPEIIIAWGSPNAENKIHWTNATESFKTLPININKLISYRKSEPLKALNHKVAVGWDGVNDCKTIEAVCGETYTLALQIEGNPATRFYGAKPLTARYIYTAPCCPAGEPSASADVEAMVDFFVNSINTDKFISPFVKAEKIVSYSGEPSLITKNYESYTLTIADGGQIQDLAAVQAAYPNAYQITRVKREGVYSTYELIQEEPVSAPAAFSTQAITVIPNCEDCPSGYTFVPAYYQYAAQVGDGGDDVSEELTDVVSGLGTVVSITKTGTTGALGNYVLVLDSEVTPEDLGGATSITFIGKTLPYCTLESATTVSWVAGDAYYKIGRDICLTLGDEACKNMEDVGTDILAYYADSDSLDVESIQDDNDGACALSFTAVQYSSNLLKEDECYTGVAVFAEPPAYKGFKWNLCPCAEPTTNSISNIGIVLTGAYVDTKFGDCAFKYSDFVELDLPRIIVTQGNPLDELGKCAKAWDVTQLQRPQYPTGTGENVKRAYIQISQFKHQLWSDEPRWREIYGFNYDFIDRNKFYKTYYLEFESSDKTGTAIGYTVADQKTTVTIAFPEGTDTSAFEALLEGWIAAKRPDLIDGDYKDNVFR